MKIISASFFWRNDQPLGLGFTLGPEVGWDPEELTTIFTGPTVSDYFTASDELVSDGIAAEYLNQLSAIAIEAKRGPLPLSKALIAALNIMWLTERGHLQSDEFNGPMFAQSE